MSNFSPSELARIARVKAILKSAEKPNRIVGVNFTKKNGDSRTMAIQFAAMPARIKGASASESAQRGVETRARNNPHLINVYEVSNGGENGGGGFKSLSALGVNYIKIDGQVIHIE